METFILFLGALMIHPPTKQPCDTSTQAQLTHGPPPGSANKQFVVTWGGPLIALRFYTPLCGSIVSHKLKKKLTGGRNVKAPCFCG
jgi:hypothetical protein